MLWLYLMRSHNTLTFAMQRYKIKIKKPHPSCDARAGQCVSLYMRNRRIWCCKQDSDVAVKGEKPPPTFRETKVGRFHGISKWGGCLFGWSVAGDRVGWNIFAVERD